MPRLTKLKLTRIEHERAQIDVAMQAGINPTRMNRLENGWLQPRADELQRIAGALGVPVGALAMKEPTD